MSCPYCTNPFVNDGRFAGQLVQCPRCGGQMQMPEPTPPPIAETANSVSAAIGRTTTRKPKSGSHATLLLISIGAVLIAATVVFYGFSDRMNPPKRVSDRKPARSARTTEPTDVAPSKRTQTAENNRVSWEQEKGITESQQVRVTTEDARRELQNRIDRYLGGQKEPRLLGGLFSISVGTAGVTKSYEGVAIQRIGPKYSESGVLQTDEFVATLTASGTDYKGRPFVETFEIFSIKYKDNQWSVH